MIVLINVPLADFFIVSRLSFLPTLLFLSLNLSHPPHYESHIRRKIVLRNSFAPAIYYSPVEF
jgi:hypothetical protein